MLMPPRILVHCPQRTARHEAAFTWTLGSALGLEWAWADAAPQPSSSDDVHLLYGVDGEAGVRFPAEGLLSEVEAAVRAPARGGGCRLPAAILDGQEEFDRTLRG